MHEALHRTVPGSSSAVLMVHGIAGSPEQFRKLIPLEQAVPETVSLYNLCLPGHGGKVTDFGKSSMKQWKRHTEEKFLELASAHDRIYLVGHSMGTLFLIDLARKYPEKIAGLFLLQCPLYVGLRWFGVKNLLRLPFGLPKGKDPYGAAMRIACGEDPTWFLPAYIPWIFRLLELFLEMGRTRRQLQTWQGSAVVFQSRRDELVSNRSAAFLKKYTRFSVTELESSSHFYYQPEDRQRMLTAFAAMIEK